VIGTAEMTSPKPVALKVWPRNIPQAIKEVDGWVLWRWWWSPKSQKWTKPPYNVDGVKIDEGNPENWMDYSTVLQAYRKGDFDGIGFSLDALDGLAGVDLDHCVKEGDIEPWALEIVEEMGSYAEISPSGRGLRVLGYGKLRRKGRKKGDIEMYTGGRYLTITGHRLDGVFPNIQNFDEALDKVHWRVWPTPPEVTAPRAPQRGREEDLAERFQALLDDDPTFKERFQTPATVGDRSDNEFFLCAKLWEEGFSEDEIRILMDSSPQSKWNDRGEDYRENTLQNAISSAGAPNPRMTRPASMRTISEEELAAMKMDNGPKFELNLPGNHYLTRYIAYGRDVSDAYPDYWLAGGLYQLAVIADKKIWVKLRQGPVYPNLYIFMAGRSSLSRKSTVVDVSESLLNDHGPGTAINAVPTEFSPEAFIEHLDECPHAPWVRDEAAGVLSTMRRDYMRGFKDSLMQLYDCRPIHRKLRTNQRKKAKTEFIVDDPYLNVLWATTDSSLAANTEINDTLSGFMARFIYHFPRRQKERWLPLEEGDAMNSELELVVRGQLTAMSKTVAGMVRQQLKFSPEAAEYWTRWQQQRATEIEKRDDANEMQIHSRLVPLVAKLAMLFELGSSDFDPGWRQPIRLEYVVEACRLVDEYYQPMAMAVYDMVGRDLEKNVIDRIIAFLKRHGGVSTKREISRHVKIKAKELQEYLDTMAGDGTIEYCEIKNPRGEATIKVVLNVGTVYNVDKVDKVDTVTRNTGNQEDERNTESEDHSSSCGEGVTDKDRNPGDSEDTGDKSDSSDRSTVCPPTPQKPKAATTAERTEPPRIFGKSRAYYLQVGGGQIPTIRQLMDDIPSEWTVEKAKMAIHLLEEKGESRGFNCPD